jgi:hypothetical protein
MLLHGCNGGSTDCSIPTHRLSYMAFWLPQKMQMYSSAIFLHSSLSLKVLPWPKMANSSRAMRSSMFRQEPESFSSGRYLSSMLTPPAPHAFEKAPHRGLKFSESSQRTQQGHCSLGLMPQGPASSSPVVSSLPQEERHSLLLHVFIGVSSSLRAWYSDRNRMVSLALEVLMPQS